MDIETIMLLLDDAERELAWYLQHETFNAEREKKIRAECCQLRNDLAALVPLAQ